MTVKIQNATPAVQNLWMNGEFPVDEAMAKIYFASDDWQSPSKAACARVFVTGFACLHRRNA